MIAEIRYLASTLTSKQRRIIGVVWPACLSGFLATFILLSYEITGIKWISVGLGGACLCLDLLAFWRLKPMLKGLGR